MEQIQFNIDKFVRPHVMPGEKQEESRPRKLDLLSLAGDDAFAATSNAPHRPEEKDLPLIKVRRGHVTTRSQEVQTGPDVTTLSSRNEILSPSHGWEWSEQGTAVERSYHDLTAVMRRSESVCRSSSQLAVFDNLRS